MKEQHNPEYVILVDKLDNAISQAEKISAHKNAQLHRAFSVFVYRSISGNLELLLQQRALHKYHAGGLWTNTCCSHPRPGEDTLAAASRRLQEEVGLVQLPLQEIFSFTYYHAFDNGLAEHEFDHVLLAAWQEQPLQPNAEEVAALRWVEAGALLHEIAVQPQTFSPWFVQAVPRVLQHLQGTAL